MFILRFQVILVGNGRPLSPDLSRLTRRRTIHFQNCFWQLPYAFIAKNILLDVNGKTKDKLLLTRLILIPLDKINFLTSPGYVTHLYGDSLGLDLYFPYNKSFTNGSGVSGLLCLWFYLGSKWVKGACIYLRDRPQSTPQFMILPVCTCVTCHPLSQWPTLDSAPHPEQAFITKLPNFYKYFLPRIEWEPRIWFSSACIIGNVWNTIDQSRFVLGCAGTWYSF